MTLSRLRQSIEDASLTLLNQVDRDPHSRLRGCCDRRFWGWKLVDFPDATLQRSVQPLAWTLEHAPNALPVPADALADTIVSALVYLESIQHRDGSFDQAYPHEHSVAGTAFLLDSAAAAMKVVDSTCDTASRVRVHRVLERAAMFLCRRDETHGLIANHVAGSVLALLRAESLLGREDFGRRADALLAQVLDAQSSEGWFPEYDGCDPGYLTLCVYYLAQARTFRPSQRLTDALARAVAFLSHFVHPDGTFGGVYGSRRTAVYYAGGIALLARELPLAARMTRVMLQSADERHTLGPGQPDVGNAVPVLANYQLALTVESGIPDHDLSLPCETATSVDFPKAGLYLRGSSAYWAVVGASNGGTVSAWDRASGQRVVDDGGWVGQAGEQRWTSQVTVPHPRVSADATSIEVRSQFRRMQQRVPGVPAFVALRLAGLAIRWPAIGERVKRVLVRMLLQPAEAADAQVRRTVRVGAEGVAIDDELTGSPSFWRTLTTLECGRPFSAIHMASAGYVVYSQQMPRITHADLSRLAQTGTYNVSSTPSMTPVHEPSA